MKGVTLLEYSCDNYGTYEVKTTRRINHIGTLPMYTGTLPIVYKLVPRSSNRRATSCAKGLSLKPYFTLRAMEYL
ncbi:hypothetical protein CZ814_03968 [Photobacterium toruni]|uniref:Uncharacterized protein n=1 Tax=Photobacterium toruni TaxID=1935446 RepID=A0A1T4V0F3_9GAMM|nr:hypothetical protein CZ814_03968 [Photobacterium toruni]